ncbi:MAG: helix-hairpin-helix domain-containing protein [Desulfosarcinaceae bacterium]|nr:helix-hairpin-helix domain-containing protein [Desulfosarcinaceae bacterium]
MRRSIKYATLAVATIALLLLAAGSGIAAGEKVDINSATLEELMSLKFVGETIAKRIIEYREKMTGFKTAEAIMEVKGFGQKAWEANKDRIIAMPYKKK